MLQVVADTAAARLDLDPADVEVERRFGTDLPVDSLAFVEFVLDLEDHFGVELPETELAGPLSVGSLVELLLARVAAAAPAVGPR